MTDQANRDETLPDYTQLPWESLAAIAKVFVEGEAKYGRHNWRTGGEDYRRDAANHAFEHLKKYTDGRFNGQSVMSGEDDLAKVGWWVLTELWHRDKEKDLRKAVENIMNIKDQPKT